MDCQELSELLPDLIDGTLSEELRAEAEAALPNCPECQRQVELASQVRAMLVALQVENSRFRVPPGFEARLLARVQQQSNALALLDLSSQMFALWLVELINLIGGFVEPPAGTSRPGPQRA